MRPAEALCEPPLASPGLSGLDVKLGDDRLVHLVIYFISRDSDQEDRCAGSAQ